MIRTESLTKFYGRRCAVRDLSVAIADHEIVGFLGLNGAGKSTTLRMLAGLLAPSSGKIEVEGRDLGADDAGDMRWRIGFLPDRPPLYDDMTVRAYLEFAARLRGYHEDKVSRRVGEVLELTAIKEYADEVITTLSHGYRQRVGIAQAVVHEPALVILDEPTSGLDPVQIIEMRSVIRELKAHHTVLLSSHNLPEISQTCDRLLVIRGGELVATGSEAELSGKLGGAGKVEVEVVGAIETIEATLAKAKAAGTISGHVRGEANGTINLTVSLNGHPEALAKLLIESGIGLRRLQPAGTELESLFLELTKAGS
jgi:ABC-2 type transport system ATP-binding protein